MNIYEKMLAITAEMGVVNKNLEVGYGSSKYKAVGEADVLKAVKELEKKYGIYSFPSNSTPISQEVLTKETYNERTETTTKSPVLFLRLEREYTFVNVEKPEERITIKSYGDGVDPQDKAPGKAMTYADKYALMKAYKITTGDDPDQEKSEQKTVVEQNEKEYEAKVKALAEKQIDDNHAKALSTSITNAKIDEKRVAGILAKYGYASIIEIKNKDYMTICNELKALKEG